MTALHLVPVILGGAAVVAVGVAYWLRSRRKSPDERERERRHYLNTIGRITDGNVLDVQEFSLNGHGQRQMLIYTYDVAGVTYEASQDVTYLRQLVDVHSCRLGLPASVKYDTHNPGNSIVVAEGWTGLRMRGR
jgi:hypothetical protein